MIYENRVPPDIEKKAKKTLGKTHMPHEIDTSVIQVIEPREPFRGKTEVIYTTGEFTSLCPFSEMPDFGTITIRYVPDRKLIELKSLKYYLYSFRQVKIYMEEAVNKILEDLVKACHPVEMEVTGKFNIRGGITTEVRAVYRKRSRAVDK